MIIVTQLAGQHTNSSTTTVPYIETNNCSFLEVILTVSSWVIETNVHLQ
jgi:hypothetical protein